MKKLLLSLFLFAGLSRPSDYQFTPYGTWYMCNHYNMLCAPEALHTYEYILLINNEDYEDTTLSYSYNISYKSSKDSATFTGTVERFDDGYNWSYIILRFSEEIEVLNVEIWAQ